MDTIRGAKIISVVKRKRNFKRMIAILLVIALLQFLAVECLLIFGGNPDEETETEYLVILGAGIKGETLSLSLYERLKTGLAYLKKYPDTRVVVSGGQGRGEAITEAEAMRRFLVSNGIDESRILIEDQSTSTMENFAFSKRVIESDTGRPITKISFVTSSFHILRAKMLAGRNGLEAYALSAGTPRQVIVQTYFREYMALLKSLVVDR